MAQIRSDIQLNCERFFSAIKSVDNSVAGLGKKIAASASMFAGLAAAGALIVMQFSKVKQALDLGGSLSDLAANTGQSVSDLVVLRQAFQDAGAGADSLGGFAARLQKALSGINDEGQPTKEVFDQLGVSIHALRAMSLADQIATLGRAFRAMPNEADRAKAAMDLFGGSGRKMLALFADESAIENARIRVGALGSTMEENANRFDAVSDAIGAMQTKFEQFYSGLAAGIAGQIEGPLKQFADADFTKLGEGVGGIVSAFLKLAQILRVLLPLWIALGVTMATNSLKLRANGRTMGLELGYAARVARIHWAAFARDLSGMNFANFKAAGKAAMAGVVAAGKAAAASLKAAFSSTGLWIVAVFEGLQFAAAKYFGSTLDQLKAYSAASSGITSESEGSNRRRESTKGEVASEEERLAALKAVAEELETVKGRLADVGNAYQDLTGKQQDDLRIQFRNWIRDLEASQRALEGLPAPLLAARREAREKAAALAEAKKNAEELQKTLKKLQDELAKTKDDDFLDSLSKAGKRDVLLDRAGGFISTVGLDARLEELRSEVDGKDPTKLPDAEAAAVIEAAKEYQRLLEIRKELVGVERQIADSLKQQEKEARDKADQADKEAHEAREKLARFERDFGLELDRLRAEAAGDEEAARAADRAARRQRHFDQAKDAGAGDEQALRLAEEAVDLEDAAEARKGQDKKTFAIADADRRVGLGGLAMGGTTDPLVKAQQQQTKATGVLTKAVGELSAVLKTKPHIVKEIVGPVFK